MALVERFSRASACQDLAHSFKKSRRTTRNLSKESATFLQRTFTFLSLVRTHQPGNAGPFSRDQRAAPANRKECTLCPTPRAIPPDQQCLIWMSYPVDLAGSRRDLLVLASTRARPMVLAGRTIRESARFTCRPHIAFHGLIPSPHAHENGPGDLACLPEPCASQV